MSDSNLKKPKKKKDTKQNKKLFSERLKIDTKLLRGQLYRNVKKKTFGER